MRRALFVLLSLCGCYEGHLEQGLTLTCTADRHCPVDHRCQWGRCAVETSLAAGTVTPRFARASTTVVAAFDASTLSVPPTVYVADTLGNTLGRFNAGAAGFEWVSPPELDAGVVAAVVLADVTSGGRVSLGHLVGHVTLDYVAPLVSSTAPVITPAADNPLSAPVALGGGSTLAVSTSADEPLADGGRAWLASCVDGGVGAELAEEVRGPSLRTFRGQLDDGGVQPQGCYLVMVALRDLAGNTTVQPVGELVVDTLPPEPPLPGDRRIVYRREPEARSFTVRVSDGGLEPGNFLVVTRLNGTQVLGVLSPDGGDTVALMLDDATDLKAVMVAAADPAGNRSTAVLVTDVEWVGSGRLSRGAGLELIGRSADTQALRQAGEEGQTPPPLDLDAGELVVRPSASWRTIVSNGSLQTAPSQRYAAFACDEERRTCLLFGGQRSSGAILNETWRWDGDGWREVNVDRAGVPRPRFDAAMAYDAQRQRYVLVGGEGQQGEVFDEVWEWSEAAGRWSKSSEPFVTGVKEHAMTYDFARRRVQLFGGVGGGPGVEILGLWERDAQEQWVRRALTQRPRQRHAMVYDRRALQTLVIGGTEVAAEALLAFASRDGAALTVAAGPDRAAHGAAYDPVSGRVFVVRGYRKGDMQQHALPSCMVWPGDGGPWSDAALDCGNFGWDAGEAWAVASVQSDGLVVHGATDIESAASSLLLPLDGGTRQRRANARQNPLARRGHTLTPLGDDDERLVLIAGSGAGSTVLDDASMLESGGWRGIRADAVLQPVEMHAAVPAQLGVRVFGRLPDGGNFGAQFRAGADPAWINLPNWGLPRTEHAATARNDGAFTFGGVVLEPDGGSRVEGALQRHAAVGPWVDVPVGVSPAPRRSASLNTLGDQRLILFGGSSHPTDSEPLGDTWVFSSTGWAQLAGAGPPARFGHATAVERDGGLVLFGGRVENGVDNETWQLSGDVWSRVPIADPEGDSEPSGRLHHAMAAARSVLLFGGGVVAREPFNDTWELQRHSAAQLVRIGLDQIASPGARLLRVKANVRARSPDAGTTASLWHDGAFRELPQLDGGVDELVVDFDDADVLRRMSLGSDIGIVVRPRAQYPAQPEVRVGPTRVELHYRLQEIP
ncbi:MAG: hypothetical protein JNK82_42145 [Myxococcaceae bacterium]|nr:hypothetical protein [Myxococcaceae bacterium]